MRRDERGSVAVDRGALPPVAAAARRLAAHQYTPLVGVILVIAVVAQATDPVFLSEPNVLAILRSAVTTFVIGCAATIVFTAGGLDLSVGAVFTLGAVVSAQLMVAGWPWVVACLVGIGVGGLLGVLNAFLVLVARVPPIIATLSTLYAVTGVALVLTGGNFVTGLPEGFTAVGQGTIGSVPLLVVYAVVVGLVAHVVLAHTRFGYDVKALGGNEKAARSNGVRTRRLTVAVYALSGAVAAFAGLLFAARTGAADPQAGGTAITLQVIAAVLVGGSSLFGGIGSVGGTALGALLFAGIQNALTVVGIDPLYQSIVIGVILAGAVSADSWRRSRAFRVG